MTSWLLVHSPLLGPGSWRAVAQRLDGEIAVPDLRTALDSTDIVAAQAQAAAGSVTGDAVAIVGHSGAGPLLPSVAAALTADGVRVTQSVFVDAGLPHPGMSRLDTLPPPIVERLIELESDGALPPWPTWFPPAAMKELLADERVRAEFTADCPSLPWRLFTEPLPDADESALGRCAYVRLSAAYDQDATAASARGWTTRSLDSNHLALVGDPEIVVAALRSALS